MLIDLARSYLLFSPVETQVGNFIVFPSNFIDFMIVFFIIWKLPLPVPWQCIKTPNTGIFDPSLLFCDIIYGTPQNYTSNIHLSNFNL